MQRLDWLFVVILTAATTVAAVALLAMAASVRADRPAFVGQASPDPAPCHWRDRLWSRCDVLTEPRRLGGP